MVHVPLVFTLVGSLMVCFAAYAILRRDDPFLDSDPFGAPQVDTTLDNAERALAEGRVAEAMSLTKRAMRQDPDNPRAGLLRAHIHAVKGEPGKALEAARCVLKRFPNYGPAQELIEELEA